MIGDVLKFLREQKNVTQGELAEVLNVTRTTVSHYESNLNEPSLETLITIANFFEVTTDFLLGVNTIHAKNITHEEYFKDKFNALVDEFYIIKK